MHEWIVRDGCAVFQSPFMMKTMGKSDHEHPLLHPSFLALHKSSSASVAFDISAPLNDAIPANPMLFPVVLMRMKRVGCRRMSFVCCFFCVHLSDKFQ